MYAPQTVKAQPLAAELLCKSVSAWRNHCVFSFIYFCTVPTGHRLTTLKVRMDRTDKGGNIKISPLMLLTEAKFT